MQKFKDKSDKILMHHWHKKRELITRLKERLDYEIMMVKKYENEICSRLESNPEYIPPKDDDLEDLK